MGTIFINIDLLFVGIAGAAIAILGTIVFLSNRKSITNQSFLFFSLMTIAYGIFNLNYRISNEWIVLLFLRLTLFFAVWHAYSFFQLFFVFPKESITFPPYYKKVILPIVSATSLLTLTPWVFSRISEVAPEGQVTNPDRGAGIAIFGIVAVLLVVGGIYLLAKKIIHSEGEERAQLKITSTGTFITFFLLVTFNFILPVIFNELDGIPYAPLYILPFIAFTTYAIIKHKLLNVKIIATEILTFVLSVVTFLEIIFAHDLSSIIFRSALFLLVLSIGLLLIKNVRKEVEQRVQLQRLTEQLQDANEKLKALDVARTEFISIASHQLRTPPATIKWYLAAILEGDYGRLNPELKKALQKTAFTNNGLISLIEDLLNVSRIERGTMEFLFEQTDVLAITQAAFDQLLPIAHEKNLKFILKKPRKKMPLIMADKEKLRQVINNLIDNALKYTQKGKVTVELSITDQDLILQVRDTGKGLEAEDFGTIFHKYVRGKDSHHQSMGLGLGLYVARIIVEQHHGKIWAESAGEGKGSSFIISLPLYSTLQATSLLDLTKS